MQQRKELTEAIGTRYRDVSTNERSRILDEFVAVTGYHRKHAIRVLVSGHKDDPQPPKPPRNRLYDEAVHQALIVL